jgi:hypothetical protein
VSLTALLNLPCSISHRFADPDGGTDAYGNPLGGTLTVETVCELQRRQQSQGSEDTRLGAIATDDWLLVVPAGTVLSAQDTVTVDGVAYEVDGEPWPARNPRTRTVSHVEASLRRTTAPDDDPA